MVNHIMRPTLSIYAIDHTRTHRCVSLESTHHVSGCGFSVEENIDRARRHICVYTIYTTLCTFVRDVEGFAYAAHALIAQQRVA